MTLVRASDDEVLRVIGDRIRVLADGAATEGRFELFEVEGERGSGPPPHAHPWTESFVVVDGAVLVEWGDERAVLEARSSVIVPAECVHRFEVTSPVARFLTVTAGDRASRFFFDLSQAAPGPPTPETLPAIVEVARRNGLTSPLF